MQSEDFDNKVRNAAEHHHPAYDENAWNKMEQLLDKHLPEEKDDRKRRFLFILLFLLLGSGAWLIATKPWEKNNTIATVKQESSIPEQQTLVPKTNNTSSNDKQTVPAGSEIKTQPGTDNTSPENNVTQAGTPVSKQTIEKKELASAVKIKKDNASPFFIPQRIKKEKLNQDDLKIAANEDPENNKTINKQQQVIAENAIKNNGNPLAAAPSGVSNNPAANEDNSAKDKSIPDSKTIDTKDDSKDDIKKEEPFSNKPVAKKTANKKSYFFFSLSAGPDVSFAGSGKAGTAKLLTGAGLGYTFNNKLTIRTGFYTARKIYSSGADAYHPPSDFYTYYPYLQKVNANCKVYEIPLLLSYSFGKSSKQNWFASTGLSSYLMKSEVYNYDYKTTATGPTMKGKWVVDNENKHFFSVLNLSGGYQRNLNKNISLTIEPYVKLPLTGVGYGKVKLNSGGVLFTVGIKPFK